MNSRYLYTPRLMAPSEGVSESIHQASLEILRRTGVRVHHAEARQSLGEAGALLDDGDLVRIPSALVEWALERAPTRVVLCRRGTGRAIVRLEGRTVAFGPGSDCPNYLDPRTGEHRLYASQDVVDSIRLIDALDEMDFCMSMGIPSDIGTPSPYQQQYAWMLEHTVKPVVFVCDDRSDCEAIVAMAAAAAGGRDKLQLNPTVLLYSEPSTPLQHSYSATDKLLFMAESGLPVVHSPAPMMGGTAPVTPAGALALGNAEVLSSLVMHQLKRPGSPFVYGVQAHHMDMKSTISVYGAPEYQLARVLNASMGRFYGLPIWGNAGMTDSCALDEQAAADVVFSVMVAYMTGTHLAHDVGYMEAGLTTSPELIRFTAEVIAMQRRFSDGIHIDAESLALEVVEAVGPGGNFLTHDHTLEHFREFWQPDLFSRQRMVNWLASGGKRMGERLKESTIAILDEHQVETLPGSVRDEISYIMRTADRGYEA